MRLVSSILHGLCRQAQLSSFCSRAQSTDLSHLSPSIAERLPQEKKRGALKSGVLPIVLERGYGLRVWDVEGREYLDFLASHNAVVHGHCHPRLVTTLAAQAATLTPASCAVRNNKIEAFEQKLCTVFGYDHCLPLTTGAEACETAIKLARRWAYERKKVPKTKAKIVCTSGNYLGNSLTALSTSADTVSRRGFGPFTPGFKLIKFGDLRMLEQALSNPHVAAFMVEPILCGAGVILPPRGYMRAAKELCVKHNTLLIANEMQTGLGRTGRLLCVDHDMVRPDLVTLGSALSSGLYPVSAVLGSDEVIGLLQPKERESTITRNPLACAVAVEAIDVMVEEKFAERAEKLGKEFREELRKSLSRDLVKDVRGMGLVNAVEVHGKRGVDLAGDICLALAQQGVLVGRVSETTIRFAPPLVVTENEMARVTPFIRGAIQSAAEKKPRRVPFKAKSKK